MARTPARGRWLALLAALLAILPAAAGCGLFDVRDPLTPVDPEDIPHRTANHPDSVVFNFSAGVSYKTIGDVAIGSALADSFYFVLDLLDVPGGQPDSLNKQEVRTGLSSFFKRIVKADSVAIRIDLALALREVPGSDIWSYYGVPYVMSTYLPDGKPKQVLCAGTIDLQFQRQTSGTWAMYRWYDKTSDAAPLTLGARILPGSGHGS